MKKSLFFFFAMMLSCLTSLAQVQITKAQALQVVKNHYPSNGLFNYYIAETDSIFDDGDDSCIFDSIPQQDWLTSKTDPKWLIFVDEDPLAGWSHSCSYYYIPQEFSYTNENNIPIVRFNGRKFPRHITFDETLNPNPLRLSSDSPILFVEDEDRLLYYLFDPQASTPTIVLLIGGGYSEVTNNRSFWYDMKYFYKTLRQKYDINPFCFVPFFPNYPLYSYTHQEYETRGSLDGLNWIYEYKNTKEDIYSYVEELISDSNNDNNFLQNTDLIIFISAHGELDINNGHSYVCLSEPDDPYPSNTELRLYDYELNNIINSINARSTTVIIGSCCSGGFADNITSANTVNLTACMNNEYSYNGDSIGTSINPNSEFCYSYFLNHVTNAIHEHDIYGNPVQSDSDSDGRISMQELYDYANLNRDPEEHPQYSCNPNSLGSYLSFDELLDTASLYVRDNLQDVGYNIHASSGTFWNSPDIWVRNDDDGFYYKENDHLLVGSDEKLYIYVRVNNRGYRNYVDPSKYLHLYWKENTLNMSKDAIFGTGSPYGGKITTLSLDTAIAVDTSCIYRYVWQLPTNLVSRAASNGSILDIEVLALVNNSTTSVIPDDDGGMIALRENSNVAMRKENTILPSLGVYVDGGGMMVYQDKWVVTIPIYVNADNDAISKITLISDSSSSGNSFGFCNYYLELSPGIYNLSSNLSRANITTTNSAPRKYKLNADGSSFEFKVPQNGVDSLIFYCEYNNRAPRSDINHILHLKMTNSCDSVIDVETYTIKIDATGGTVPGIIMLNGNDGSCQLVATDISEPSRIEWFNPQDELIGESDTLCLNASRQQGEYTLRVASEKTGAVAYANAIIHDEPAIESISPNPFNGQFTVRLSHPAVANTIIRLSPLNGNGRVAEYPVNVDERELAVSAESCVSGIYIVSLIENGRLTGSSRIIKN